MVDDEVLRFRVEESLRGVIDPELGASLVDLGMIKKVNVKDGIAVIEMTLTSPFCPLSAYLTSEVKKAAESVKGVKKVEVRVVGYGPPQQPTR